MNKIELLERLISFDTTSYKSNLELISFIQSYLNDFGITSRLTYDDAREKANLFASIADKNGNYQGGILFSGHTDVVPVAGQNWNTDPFKATIIDDKLYGRGSCDMKGFIAVVLSLIPNLERSSLNKPIHLAFSYDEEVGCIGISRLLTDIQNCAILPEACIVGEPSNMQVITGHKGINVFKCKVTGQAAHSSLTPKGCNAIEYAAMIICKIRELAQKLRLAEQNSHYDVPFSTMSTNLINGGNAENIIPGQCEFKFELRNLPNNDPEVILLPLFNYVNNELLPLMHKELEQASVEFEQTAKVPGFSNDNGKTSKVCALARELCNNHEIHKVAYATEAGLINNANIDTIVCGPGSIEVAHKANEFVLLSQLAMCESFLTKLVARF